MKKAAKRNSKSDEAIERWKERVFNEKVRVLDLASKRLRLAAVLRECEAFVAEHMRTYSYEQNSLPGELLSRIREALKL